MWTDLPRAIKLNTKSTTSFTNLNLCTPGGPKYVGIQKSNMDYANIFVRWVLNIGFFKIKTQLICFFR